MENPHPMNIDSPSIHRRSIPASNPHDLLSICLLLYPRHFLTPYFVDVTATLFPPLLHVLSAKNSQHDNPTKTNSNLFLSPWITYTTSPSRQHTNSSSLMILAPQPNHWLGCQICHPNCPSSKCRLLMSSMIMYWLPTKATHQTKSV